MKNDLKTAIDTRLSDMDWHGEDVVLRRIHAPRSTVRLRTVAVLFAVLLLLCATAVALTLQFSTQYNLLKQARSAVSAKYGLTDEMLDLFSTDAQHTKSGWIVRFTPMTLNMEAIGVYTVTCGENGTAMASWSHDDDGASSLNTDDLSANVWGAQQLERALRLRRSNAAAWSDAALGMYENLTLEERAALDAPLLQSKDAVMLINIAPDETDIPLAKAKAMAQKAVAEKYGVALDALAGYSIQASFHLATKDNTREYSFSFSRAGTNKDSYVVRLLSPSGEVIQCKWWVEPESRTPPDGDLAQHVEAAREYANSGAFELLSARDKARVAEQFKKAGLFVLLPAGEYLLPGSTDIPEAEALAKARTALEKEYGFTADTLAFFSPRVALLTGDGRRTWQITYSPTEQADWHWVYNDKLGAYTVTLTAQDGSMTSCIWSLQGMEDDAAYTGQTFGAANAYSARMLPWLKKLTDSQQAILKKYPEDVNRGYMSIEDDAAYDELMRQAGFDEKNHTYVTPSVKDIQRGEAVTYSKRALETEYGLAGPLLDACETVVNCNMNYSLHNAPVKVWGVTFFGYGPEGMDNYTVILNARTGEVEAIYHDSPASGNG